MSDIYNFNRREMTESRNNTLDSLEKLVKFVVLVPQAICSLIILVIVMSYLFKAYIVSDRNQDSYWWHFGEVRFYAWDGDWWDGFVVSTSVILVGIAIIIVLWLISIFCSYRIDTRRSQLEMRRLAALERSNINSTMRMSPTRIEEGESIGSMTSESGHRHVLIIE